MLEPKRISFIGCGNMGEAIMQRLLESGIVEASNVDVAVRSGERQSYLRDTYNINVMSIETIAQAAEFIFLAIKPQQLDDLPVFNVKPGAIVISVLAGTTVEKLKAHFHGAQIVRTMPNLGYTVGNSVTGVFFDNLISWQQTQQEYVQQLLSTGGVTIDVDDEDKLNAITAVAGSGPAYFYWFAERIAESAKNLGFNDIDAQNIAREVFIGAAEVLKANPDTTLSEWRERVTSKGGTTESALNVLNASTADSTIVDALETARNRSRELSS